MEFGGDFKKKFADLMQFNLLSEIIYCTRNMTFNTPHDKEYKHETNVREEENNLNC